MTDEARRPAPPGEGHGGHRMRLRKRAREERLGGFEPHEVLELLLFHIIPRRDVNQLAHRLIDRFGSVDAVLRADVPELMRVEDAGRATARWLCEVGEAVHAYEALTPEDLPLLRNYRQVSAYLRDSFRPLPEDGQTTWLFMLSSGCRLIQSEMLCDSLSWGEPQTLRDALERILHSQASGILLVETVPNRPPLPEEYETKRLEMLCSTLRAIRVRLWDLLLVGQGQVYSMLRCGDFERSAVLNEYTSALRETYLAEETDDGEDDSHDMGHHPV